MVDYATYYHPERNRKMRQLLADKDWQAVYFLAREEQRDMGKLVLLAQAQMAQEQAKLLIAQLEAE